MKTSRSIRQPRTPQKAQRAKPNCEQALRLCEQAAALVKSASDELAQCWTTLGREISTGVSPTELLRRRAWCNVLELRLKERAHALEEARHSVDAVWKEMMRAAQDRDIPSREDANLFANSWSLLIQSQSNRVRTRTASIKH